MDPASDDAADSTDDAAEAAPADASDAAARVAPAAVAPAAVAAVPAPIGHTTVRVTAGGDRQTGGSISPLAGVRFIAIDADYNDPLANEPALAGLPSAAECVTGATGTCDLTVEDRTADENDGYWIVEAPTGAAPLPSATTCSTATASATSRPRRS